MQGTEILCVAREKNTDKEFGCAGFLIRTHFWPWM